MSVASRKALMDKLKEEANARNAKTQQPDQSQEQSWDEPTQPQQPTASSSSSMLSSLLTKRKPEEPLQEPTDYPTHGNSLPIPNRNDMLSPLVTATPPDKFTTGLHEMGTNIFQNRNDMLSPLFGDTPIEAQAPISPFQQMSNDAWNDAEIMRLREDELRNPLQRLDTSDPASMGAALYGFGSGATLGMVPYQMKKDQEFFNRNMIGGGGYNLYTQAESAKNKYQGAYMAGEMGGYGIIARVKERRRKGHVPLGCAHTVASVRV